MRQQIRGHHTTSQMRRASSRISRRSWRKWRISCRASCPHIPWIVTAARWRAIPAAVFGPVDAPPCILHRPFRIGMLRQGVAARVFAPQMGSEVLAEFLQFREVTCAG